MHWMPFLLCLCWHPHAASALSARLAYPDTWLSLRKHNLSSLHDPQLGKTPAACQPEGLMGGWCNICKHRMRVRGMVLLSLRRAGLRFCVADELKRVVRANFKNVWLLRQRSVALPWMTKILCVIGGCN